MSPLIIYTSLLVCLLVTHFLWESLFTTQISEIRGGTTLKGTIKSSVLYSLPFAALLFCLGGLDLLLLLGIPFMIRYCSTYDLIAMVVLKTFKRSGVARGLDLHDPLVKVSRSSPMDAVRVWGVRQGLHVIGHVLFALFVTLLVLKGA